MEFCEFTIHDPFLPGGSMIPGSIEFTDFKDKQGIQIPFTQYVYIGAPSENQDKNLHRLTVTDFQWDSFEAAELRIDATLEKNGDAKP